MVLGGRGVLHLSAHVEGPSSLPGGSPSLHPPSHALVPFFLPQSMVPACRSLGRLLLVSCQDLAGVQIWTFRWDRSHLSNREGVIWSHMSTGREEKTLPPSRAPGASGHHLKP